VFVLEQTEWDDRRASSGNAETEDVVCGSMGLVMANYRVCGLRRFVTSVFCPLCGGARVNPNRNLYERMEKKSFETCKVRGVLMAHAYAYLLLCILCTSLVSHL